MNVYQTILEKSSKKIKQLVVLIDPDKPSAEEIISIASLSNEAGVDYFFVGGSLLTNNHLEKCILLLKEHSNIPIVIFPGNNLQINANADAILLLSLISGRNAEMLIGKHVISAPYLRDSKLEIIPTGYMLIDSGKTTTVLYMSNSIPIPADKDDIAVCTAMAGEMLGLKLIYMDAGSGALNPIPASMIRNVKNSIAVPLIVGGGIKTPEKAVENCKNGADVIVIGNAIEKEAQLIKDIAAAIKGYK